MQHNESAVFEVHFFDPPHRTSILHLHDAFVHINELNNGWISEYKGQRKRWILPVRWAACWRKDDWARPRFKQSTMVPSFCALKIQFMIGVYVRDWSLVSCIRHTLVCSFGYDSNRLFTIHKAWLKAWDRPKRASFSEEGTEDEDDDDGVGTSAGCCKIFAISSSKASCTTSVRSFFVGCWEVLPVNEG